VLDVEFNGTLGDTSRWAMSWLLSPSAIKLAISRSRAVSTSDADARPAACAMAGALTSRRARWPGGSLVKALPEGPLTPASVGLNRNIDEYVPIGIGTLSGQRQRFQA
jgi:hypothetical protein